LKENIFVIGGCRSGKSSHAAHLAGKISKDRIFMATCIPHDKEMKHRVRRHQKERDATWMTLEVPLDLPDAILDNSKEKIVILVDCLTLWVSNLLMEGATPDEIDRRAAELAAAIDKASSPVVLVSNEVGTGIVPENPLARAFRDGAGFVNQKMAACCDRVVWMVAGIPVTIKEPIQRQQ
jgi:adenosylcobinamide kinase / adenosylcobinamide-phosphate guanylyltransferase